MDDYYSKRYYRVYWGGYQDRFLSITDEELPKVLIAWELGEVIFAGNEWLDCSKIINIKEDYQKTMHYNPGYELTGDDWDHIRSVGVYKLYDGYQQKIKDQIRLLDQNQKQELLQGKRQLLLN